MSIFLGKTHTTHSYVESSKTGKRYYGKIDILTSEEQYADLRFVLHDDFWTTCDWSEPKETFQELLRQRCQQLRDTYPYLVIYFSGGSDSETMLRAFIRNNIMPDEIVTNRICFNDDDPAMLDIELAIQKLRYYSPLLKDVKITINNITPNVVSKFSKDQSWIDSAFNGNIGNIIRFPTELLANFDVPFFGRKEIGHVIAEFKPVVEVRNGEWFAKIHGFGLGQWSDWFYVTPNLPKLNVKQYWMVKNYFKKHKLTSDQTIGSLGISEGTGITIRTHLARATRERYDTRFQRSKMGGIGADIKMQTNNEISILYKHIKKYAPEIFDQYVYGTVLPIIKNSNPYLLSETQDLMKIKTSEISLGK